VSTHDADMTHLEHATRSWTRRRVAARARRHITSAAVLAVVAGAMWMLAAVAAPSAAAAPSLFELQREARRTRAEMSSLQQELQSVGQKLVDAQTRLDEVNERLGLSRRQLARAEQDLDLQREILARRAATLYKTGDLDWLDILSSIQSLADIDTIRSLQRAIADQDRKDEDEAQRLAREARRLERLVEKEHEEAVVARQEVQEQQIELDQKLAERTAILQDVTRRIKKILASGGLGAALAMAKDGEFTQLTWARALLVAMRFPVTADNVAAVTAWEMAEGGHWYNTAHYNPLNTTQRMPGATVFNSVGVKAYTSWKQGLQATMITLKNGYYGGILDALKRGKDAEAVARAVGASPWGTGDFSRLL
jgi:peptidoglycan hydrolase CwlO-like protein